MRVRSLLPLIEPKSVLALTATAGPMVIRDICNTLCIPHDGLSLDTEGHLSLPTAPTKNTDSNGVKVLNCNRDNIDVFSLVLQSNDERRYLVSFIPKSSISFLRSIVPHLKHDHSAKLANSYTKS